MTKVALYCRVSTGKQDYENQIRSLKEFCQKRGFEIYKIFSETISGKESERPEFKQLMFEASQHQFDAVVVWALDRFTREGTEKVWMYLSKLNNYGVQFISYQEPYFNTDNELVRDVLFSIMGALAKQERVRISERTKAGLSKALAMGKKLGKPPVNAKIRDWIKDLRRQGKSYSEISKEVYYYTKSNNKKMVSIGFISKVLSDDVEFSNKGHKTN